MSAGFDAALTVLFDGSHAGGVLVHKGRSHNHVNGGSIRHQAYRVLRELYPTIVIRLRPHTLWCSWGRVSGSTRIPLGLYSLQWS